MKTYKLHLIQDLLSVPPDRRKDCLREIQLALSLHELAFGDNAASTEVKDFVWTDDGDKSVTIGDTNGKPVVSVKVTKA